MNKNPIGRPPKYKPEYCQELISHMASGLSFESFGGHPHILVSKQTLYRWVEEHPEFSDAKEIGTQAGLKFWEELGRDHIVSKTDSEYQGGSKSRILNTPAYALTMTNRFKWRSKLADEVPQINLNVGKMPDEELEKIVSDYLKTKDVK